MKRKANNKVIIALSCTAALLIGAALFFVHDWFSWEAHDLCADMIQYGWERCITYPMLSAELKSIVSEEEFTDRSPEGRLAMYEKLNGLVLDDRPNEKFDGRTSWFKSPCYDIIEANGEYYWVELRVDLVRKLGKTEVRNFTACLVETEGRISG